MTAGDPVYEVVVIGAGFGGIGAGVELKKAGIENFVIVEKHPDIGGTWYANTYPGVACDIPFLYYSFSYEVPKVWSRWFAPGNEVQAYAHQVADSFGLNPHFRLSTTVVGLEWIADAHHWRVDLDTGEELTARYVIASLGGLEIPKLPDIDGIDSFANKLMHSAQWDHDYSYPGKRIGIIGTGASALQIVPEMAKVASELTVFQRRGIWVAPKPDFRVDWGLDRAFARVPGLRFLGRAMLSIVMEFAFTSFWLFHRQMPVLATFARLVGGRAYRRALPGQREVAEALTPNYALGCKRPALSSDYLRTFRRKNVHLATESIVKITPTSVVTADGTEHELDVLVCATGFSQMEKGKCPPFPVHGANGFELGDFWDRYRFQAYQGVSVPNFPNLFSVIGPYAVSGISYLNAIECTTAHAVRAIQRARRVGATAVEVRREPHVKYWEQMLRRTKGSLWLSSACANSNTWNVNYHGDVAAFRIATPIEMWWGNKHFPFDHYRFTTLPKQPAVAGRRRLRALVARRA